MAETFGPTFIESLFRRDTEVRHTNNLLPSTPAQMEELALQPEELKNVRVAAFLDKRARSFPHGWRPRYCVLAGNFLFIYKSPSDPKPKRVVCVDDAVAEPCERYRSRKHAFTLVSRTGKVYTFAAESREDRDKVCVRILSGPTMKAHIWNCKSTASV